MTWLGDRLTKRQDSPSEQWGKTLPPTALSRHLIQIHSLLLHYGASGDGLELAEHSLREVAAFTRTDLGRLRYERSIRDARGDER